MQRLNKLDLQPHERIIAAWDRSTFTIEDQRRLASLIPKVGGIKVGYQALNTPVESGSSIMVGHALRVHVRQMHGPSVRIMHDEKHLDIGITMQKAAQAMAQLGVWGFTVHASGKLESLSRCVHAAARVSQAIGVTVLTDYDDSDCGETYGSRIPSTVLRLAERFAQAGGKYIVCSGQDLEHLRFGQSGDLIKVTPGVRLKGSDRRDQKRVVTPGEAIALGADFVVCGSDIFKSDDWAGNAERIAEDIAQHEQAQSV